MDCPQLRVLLERIVGGQVGAVIIYKLDRLTVGRGRKSSQEPSQVRKGPPTWRP